MKKFLFALAIVALFTSCAPKITEGEIYDKSFTKAHVSIVLIPIVHKVGKVTTTSLVPMTFFYPDSWHISYRAFNEKENKWDKATVWVTEEVFNMAVVGGWYERTDTDLDDQPRVRRKDLENERDRD